METLWQFLSLIAQSGCVRLLAGVGIVVLVVSFLALAVWARRAPYSPNDVSGDRSATKWL